VALAQTSTNQIARSACPNVWMGHGDERRP